MPTSFAVVITNYNYESFVCEAIDSVLAQTRPADRIVVVDDGSTDNSGEVLRARYGDNPLVKLVFSANGGQMAAFALGVAQCEENVVCFLDADDLWKSDYLEKIGKLYDARKDVDFVFSNSQRFGKANDVESFARPEEDFGYTAVITYLTATLYGSPTSANSMRLGYAQRCTAMPEEIVRIGRLNADTCIIIAASLFGARKYHLPTGSVRYRVHSDNGWYGSRNSPVSVYQDHIRRRLTINHCARIMGFDVNCIPLLPLEFATKPNPSGVEKMQYEKAMGPPRPNRP